MRNLPASQLNHIVREMQQGTAAAPEPTNVSEGGITAITPYRPAHQAAGSAAPKVVVTMIAGEALSTGNVVWISADNTVKKTLTGQKIYAVLGVVVLGVISGALVKITILGSATVVTDDTLIAGDLVAISTTTAGRVEKITGHNHGGATDSDAGDSHNHTQNSHIHTQGITGDGSGSTATVTLGPHDHGSATIGSGGTGNTGYAGTGNVGSSSGDSVTVVTSTSHTNHTHTQGNSATVTPGGGGHTHFHSQADTDAPGSVATDTVSGTGHLHAGPSHLHTGPSHNHSLGNTDATVGGDHVTVSISSHTHTNSNVGYTTSSNQAEASHTHSTTVATENSLGVIGVCIVGASGGGTATIIVGHRN